MDTLELLEYILMTLYQAEKISAGDYFREKNPIAAICHLKTGSGMARDMIADHLTSARGDGWWNHLDKREREDED